MKKKIIITHPHFTIPGGAGTVVLELGKKLAKNHEVYIISQKIKSEYKTNYPQIKFISLNGPLTGNLIFWLRFNYWKNKTHQQISKIINKKTIILANVFPSNWLTLSYKKINPQVRLCWYCHEPSAFIYSKKWKQAISNKPIKLLAYLLNPFLKMIDKKFANYADILFANSNYSRTTIKKIYDRDSIVIYPGVNIDNFTPLNYNEKKNEILSVGRLTKFKNFDLLIKAFSGANLKNYKLLIVGEGEEKNNLEKLINKLDLNSKVKLLGKVSRKKLNRLYARAKLFVLGSKNEPFGIVPLEALASGTTVIADNSGGPKEIITRQNGILIDMSVRTLTDTFKSLTTDESKIKLLSSASRKSVAKRFTWKKSYQKLLKHLT